MHDLVKKKNEQPMYRTNNAGQTPQAIRSARISKIRKSVPSFSLSVTLIKGFLAFERYGAKERQDIYSLMIDILTDFNHLSIAFESFQYQTSQECQLLLFFLLIVPPY